MLDCAASNLLGSVEDRRAYPPPEAVHRANAEATMRRPRASIHDGSPLAQNALAECALTGPTNLYCVLRLIELLLSVRRSPKIRGRYCPYLLRVPVLAKPQSRGRNLLTMETQIPHPSRRNPVAKVDAMSVYR